MIEPSICMGCMKDIDPRITGPCPDCGFDQDKYCQQPVVKEGVYLPLGMRLLDGQYILGRVLGHGGFGITYLAIDDLTSNRVAIKEFFPRNLVHRSPDNYCVVAYSEEDQDSFQKGLEKYLEEARILHDLHGMPGVIGVDNYFFENGTGYVVMDYLEGCSLENYLKLLGRPLEWPEALLFISPVLSSLNEVHSAGLIHRDISPDNIFVCDDGAIQLLDFGGARYAYRDYSKVLTVVLKPGYTPLEQYSHKGGFGPYTDIYAAAATLYRMISGETMPEASERVDRDPLPGLLDRIPGMPALARQVLLKALALHPEQRYASVDEFRRELTSTQRAVGSEPEWPGGEAIHLPAEPEIEDIKMPEQDPKGDEAVAETGGGGVMTGMTPLAANDLLPSGYDAVISNIKAAPIENDEVAVNVVYRRRKVVLLLVIMIVTAAGLAAGYFFYTLYPQQVSAFMTSLGAWIQQVKFW